MADMPKPAPGSLKFATWVVDAVWYLSWAATIVTLVAILVFWQSPQVYRAAVGRLHGRPGTFSLPLQVRYPPGARVAAVGSPYRTLELVGYNGVVLRRPIESVSLPLNAAYRTLVAAFFLWVIAQLRGLMHAVRRGHPFDPRNPKRIRRIAYVLIFVSPLSDVMEFFSMAISEASGVARFVREMLPGATVGASMSLNWEIVVVGLIILAISHAFDTGVRLQDDQDLTV